MKFLYTSTSKRNLIPLACSILCLIINHTITAQPLPKETVDINPYDTYDFKNHFGLRLIPNVAEAGVVKGSSIYNLHTKPQRGVEVGAAFYSTVSRSISFSIGLHGGLTARNVVFHIPKEASIPAFKYDVVSERMLSREFDISYISIPLLLEKRWWMQKGKPKFWSVLGGLNVRYSIQNLQSTDVWAAILGSSYVDVFSLEFEHGNKQKPWLNYNLGGGHSWVLGNNDIFQLHLLSNFSSTSFVKGAYIFTVPQKPVESGSYGIRGSYIGVGANYIFTGANKHRKQKR